MVKKIIKPLFCLLSILVLTGCGNDNEHQDLKRLVSKIKAMPQGAIQPLPPIQTYEPFTYDASGLRSPFEAPDATSNLTHVSIGVKPDLNRKKYFLEGFSFDAFTLVGTLEKAEDTKGLVKANQNIYLISEGDFLGRNHGRVVDITEKSVHIIELIPSGVNLWIERPRRLSLE